MVEKLSVIEKIGECSSLLTPIKEITLKVNPGGEKLCRDLFNSSLKHRGILKFETDAKMEAVSIIFNEAKISESELYAMLES